MTHYEFHEYADIFQMLEGQELDTLKADMEANGQINKIVLYQGKILDGRNRYKVCEILGIEPETIEYTGNDPLGLVLSLNLHRRHLNESQRSMVAAKIANMPWGGAYYRSANLQTDTSTSDNSASLPKISQSQAAAKLNVSERSVSDAVKVAKNAIAEVTTAVESGRLAVSAAAALVKKTPEQQREILAKCEKEGSGRLGKDGKIRPQKYQPRKKTVAKEKAEPEIEEDFLKIPLPLDSATAYYAILARFRHESEEVRNKIIKEFKDLADIIDNLND
jgi:hypothetical protein